MLHASRYRIGVVVVTCAIALGWSARPVQADSPFTAAAYYNSLLNNSNLNQEPGEGWAWHANWGMGQFTKAYEAWGDTSWLDYGVQYYDYVIDHMRTGPDGYKGWIGPHISSSIDLWQDQHIGDAILTRHMLRFAEVVKSDPALHAAYGAKADAYVDLVKVHLFEKWHARDTYHKIGHVGAYEFWDSYTPQDLSQWIAAPEIMHGNVAVTQQFNKQTAMGLNAVRLYRITGEAQYRDLAYELFGFLKSRMQHHDETYIWNFREPALVADIKPNNTVLTWIDVHPTNSGYQSTEVSDIIEAYHTGIVFTEEDIQRILNTNLNVMWNGSFSNPQFVGPNAAIRGDNGGSGQRWGALADFDQTIRDLQGAGGSDMRSVIDQAYFNNVTQATAPGFDRKYVSPDDPLYLMDWPSGDTRSLNMAFLTRPHFHPGEEDTYVGVRSLRSGMLQVALYNATGDELLLILENRHLTGSMGGRGGKYLFIWDGTDILGEPLPSGDYRIRWTLSINTFADEGYREYPVTLLPEPGSLALLACCATVLTRRSRRRAM